MPFTLENKPGRQPSALVVGAMNLDVLAIASQAALPEESTPGDVSSSAGGVGRNIAEGLSRLGINTTLLSAVGNDDAGRQLLLHCQSTGIKTDTVVTLEDANTSSYVSLHNRDGALLYAISDMGLMDRFRHDHLADLNQQLSSADLCVIESNLPEAVIMAVVDAAEKTPLVADAVSVAKCQRLTKVLPALTLLKANRHEAEALTGSAATTPLDTVIARTLALGPEVLLMTLGEEGALLATNRGGDLKITKSPPPDMQVKSVNGAGDALMSGFLAAALYGCDTDEQLRWGKVAASLSLATQKACSELLSIHSMR